MDEKKKIVSFCDLNVYQSAYESMLAVFKKIIPGLPIEEKYDLVDQLKRSSKAVPRLIAEGYSKRHQKKGFQKYLDDAMGESNETIVSLNQAMDLYPSAIDKKECRRLMDAYDKISRQLYNLALAWDNFNHCRRKSSNIDEQPKPKRAA